MHLYNVLIDSLSGRYGFENLRFLTTPDYIKRGAQSPDMPHHNFGTISLKEGPQDLAGAIFKHLHENPRIRASLLQSVQRYRGGEYQTEDRTIPLFSPDEGKKPLGEDPNLTLVSTLPQGLSMNSNVGDFVVSEPEGAVFYSPSFCSLQHPLIEMAYLGVAISFLKPRVNKSNRGSMAQLVLDYHELYDIVKEGREKVIKMFQSGKRKLKKSIS
ncbi:hypothetical protein HYU13_03845 [Candidatus Woesearchaeota archaeon]|nr:hypothetical protein [Candidatus Woesearchaeota archaeon]